MILYHFLYFVFSLVNLMIFTNCYGTSTYLVYIYGTWFIVCEGINRKRFLVYRDISCEPCFQFIVHCFPVGSVWLQN